MTRMFYVLLVFAALAATRATTTLAHHSFSAEYDAKKVVTLKGVVTRFEWTNPHVRFYVDVQDDKGTVTSWDLELMSVNTLTRAGWNRRGLNPLGNVAQLRPGFHLFRIAFDLVVRVQRGGPGGPPHRA